MCFLDVLLLLKTLWHDTIPLQSRKIAAAWWTPSSRFRRVRQPLQQTLPGLGTLELFAVRVLYRQTCYRKLPQCYSPARLHIFYLDVFSFWGKNGVGWRGLLWCYHCQGSPKMAVSILGFYASICLHSAYAHILIVHSSAYGSSWCRRYCFFYLARIGETKSTTFCKRSLFRGLQPPFLVHIRVHAALENEAKHAKTHHKPLSSSYSTFSSALKKQRRPYPTCILCNHRLGQS